MTWFGHLSCKDLSSTSSFAADTMHTAIYKLHDLIVYNEGDQHMTLSSEFLLFAADMFTCIRTSASLLVTP